MPFTPVAPTAPATPVQGKLSPPPATANQSQSAVYLLGQVLKEIIHAVPTAFPSENQQFSAIQTVDKFVAASVPVSAQRALAGIPARAPVEDVTQRKPPAGVSYSIPQSMSIDYDALARAMLKVQRESAAEQQAQLQASPAAEQAQE